ncbi:hypothetical protein RB195_007800 [Necator americanus]|uniref:Uncharacterized protein n=1 Tax=Necator americanus TaxID=51031 RepID=A0ABR1C1N1_NECAM
MKWSGPQSEIAKSVSSYTESDRISNRSRIHRNQNGITIWLRILLDELVHRIDWGFIMDIKLLNYLPIVLRTKKRRTLCCRRGFRLLVVVC